MVGSETGVLASVKSAAPVLCVDLDGTLIRSDLLWECAVSLLKNNPLSVFKVPLWLVAGRANLKTQLAQNTHLDVTALPYRQDVLEFLRQRRESGSRIVLVTASAQELASRISEYLGCVDASFGSSASDNLKGQAKAEFLRGKYGEGGFEYLGDSRADLAVWRIASTSHVVGKRSLAARGARDGTVGQVFPVERKIVHSWITALRGHHWFKNLLLFLPLALAHRFDTRAWLMTGIGFLLFGLCASGIYILNDLLDLHSDRIHPWKQKRPLAAGDISIPAALLIALLLLAIAVGAGFVLGRSFGAVLTAYALLTVLYSTSLKKIALLDTFVLSSFYSIRIWAGALITGVPLS